MSDSKGPCVAMLAAVLIGGAIVLTLAIRMLVLVTIAALILVQA